MKKIMIVFLIGFLAITAFSDLLEEVKDYYISSGKSIEAINYDFWEDRASMFNSLDEFVTQMTSNKELLQEHKDRIWLSNERMTTKDDMVMASYLLIEPKAQPESSFYRLEPVRDQMFHGSCWAFSTLGAFESARAVQVLGKAEGNVENDLDYSERWTAYHNINYDLYASTYYESYPYVIQDMNSLEGGICYFSVYNSTRYGEIPEESAPYSEIGITVQEQIPLPAKAYSAPKTNSTKGIMIPAAYYANLIGYSYDEYINMIKTAIKNYGSLSVSFWPDYEYNFYQKGLYIPETEPEPGHAVTMVGWAAVEDLDEIILAEKTNPNATPILTSEQATDTWIYTDVTFEEPIQRSTQLCWIIKNSWGYSWGDGGYYVIPAISEADYNLGIIGDWQKESNDMFVPLFDSTYKHEGDNLDINADGKINEADFNALTDMLGQTDVVIGDLAYPKDGKITNDDIAAWIYLFNQ